MSSKTLIEDQQKKLDKIIEWLENDVEWALIDDTKVDNIVWLINTLNPLLEYVRSVERFRDSMR